MFGRKRRSNAMTRAEWLESIQSEREERGFADGGAETADPNRVAKLREGVEAWNKWQKHNPSIRPTFSESISPMLRGATPNCGIAHAQRFFANGRL